MQVLGNETARADAVDINPLRPGHGVDRPRERIEIEGSGGVLNGTRVAVRDLGHDLLETVSRTDVTRESRPRAVVGLLATGLPGQSQT